MHKLSLTISHHLFLSQKKRYSLHNKKHIKIIGSNIPIWYYKGETSEPAEEIFCQYLLTNEGNKKFILSDLEGYTINLPTIPIDWKKPNLSNEEWRKMNQEKKDNWYKTHTRPESSFDLLDPPDGGRQLIFSVIHIKKIKGCQTLITHIVVIKDTLELLNTVTDNFLNQ
jgi:hypothetical protein